MKKTLLVLFLLGFASISVYAGPYDGPSTPGQTVLPTVVNVSELPQAPVISFRGDVPRGESPFVPLDFSPSIYNSPVPQQMNPNSPLAPIFMHKKWAGPNQNGWVPADADIAVGPLHVMVVTNEQFHIYDRNTNLNMMSTAQLSAFFNRPGKSIFDPKVVYDPWRGRWLMIALEKDGLNSYYWLAYSQTSNPTGVWWTWQLNAHVDGSTSTTNWADYEGIGLTSLNTSIDSGAVIITSNQYSQSNAFQYAKVRCLNVKQLYNGLGVNWWDFTNMTDENSDKTFTIKPAVNWYSTASATAYLANTKSGGGSVITLWQIVNPHRVTTGPTFTRRATVTTITYAIPPACPTPISGTTMAAGDCRTQDIVYQVGKNTSGVAKEFLYTAWPTKYNWGAGDNCVIYAPRINITDNTINNAAYFGASGFWYMYPKVAPKFITPFTGDTMAISFNLGGSTKYLSSEVMGYDQTNGTGSSVETGTGLANYGTGSLRNGDYNGICIDPIQNGKVWSVGMMTKTGGWGTGIGYLGWATASVGIGSNNGLIPDAYKLSQNFPNPFNPSSTISFALPKDGLVKLVVYDITGKEIRVLTNEVRTAGYHSVLFDASNLPSGVYLYKLTAGNFVESKKMVLAK